MSVDPAGGVFGAVSLVAALASIVISLTHIYLHLANFNERTQQLYIVRILIIVPAYAVGSLLSLHFPDQELIFDTVRDCYEAYVVYCFLALVLSYCGGDSACVQHLCEKQPLAHPWPLCRLPRMRLDGKFLRRCKQGALQFVIIKPVFAVISLILLALGQYDGVVYQTLLLLVYNVSYTWALYALLVFYMATRDLLKPFHPVWKFFAVKTIVFMTYWQSLVVTFFPGVAVQDREQWNSFILCCEMLIFAIMHCCAFSYREFKFTEGVIHTRTVLHNAKQVFNQKDVVADAYHNFMPSYNDYVLHKPYEEAPPRKYRTRTFLFGNLVKFGKTKQSPSIVGQDSLAARDCEIDLTQLGPEPEPAGATSTTNGHTPLVPDRSTTPPPHGSTAGLRTPPTTPDHVHGGHSPGASPAAATPVDDGAGVVGLGLGTRLDVSMRTDASFGDSTSLSTSPATSTNGAAAGAGAGAGAGSSARVVDLEDVASPQRIVQPRAHASRQRDGDHGTVTGAVTHPDSLPSSPEAADASDEGAAMDGDH